MKSIADESWLATWNSNEEKENPIWEHIEGIGNYAKKPHFDKKGEVYGESILNLSNTLLMLLLHNEEWISLKYDVLHSKMAPAIKIDPIRIVFLCDIVCISGTQSQPSDKQLLRQKSVCINHSNKTWEALLSILALSSLIHIKKSGIEEIYLAAN